MKRRPPSYAKNAEYSAEFKQRHADDPEYRAAHYRDTRRWALANPEATRAHKAVYRAIKSGRLVRPDRCSRCGTVCKPEASHDDYERPLDVEWLCRRCHVKKDRGEAS